MAQEFVQSSIVSKVAKKRLLLRAAWFRGLCVYPTLSGRGPRLHLQQASEDEEVL